MKLGFRANMSKQKPSLCKGSKNVTQIQKSMASSSQLKSEAVFFYCEGIIHHELVPRGQMVNKEYYLKVMKRLREAVRRKRHDLWRGKNWCSIITTLWHIPPF